MTGSPFARYWLHNGMLTVGGAKMAKSEGNFITVRDALAEAPGEVIRLALLGTHYRDPLDWTDDRLRQARQSTRPFLPGADLARDPVFERSRSSAGAATVERGAGGRSERAARAVPAARNGRSDQAHQLRCGARGDAAGARRRRQADGTARHAIRSTGCAAAPRPMPSRSSGRSPCARRRGKQRRICRSRPHSRRARRRRHRARRQAGRHDWWRRA